MRRILCSIAVVALVGCGKPTGTLDRYLAAQPVASGRDMGILMDLLRKGDVAGFNHARTNRPYAGKRLDFRRQNFVGLSAGGADFSNSIFACINFTGADLNHASFRGSYLASAIAQVEMPWLRPPPRRTCLANCDFTAAVLNATEYVTTSEFSEPIDVWTKMDFQFGLGGADVSGAVGLEPLLAKQR
ncbi:MAG TPA: pentapeptide repeat-containing protein [Candidatus Acidoferrum sp.]|nr:pentapeptide repeat-containing protein [Candidatus Acidoferrum sp.]